MAGAILVYENTIIAQGIHRGFGQVHAERELLTSFTGNIPDDAILYVNLEPCCHQGKTPPCTDLILERGVKRMCFGMVDPDPRVLGNGITFLCEHGVEVMGPVARAACEYFNRGFVSMRTLHRPWVILKSARTKEGKIAREDGAPLRITGEEQDRWAHSALRSKVDAILVGVRTAESDDPHLDTRMSQGNRLKTGQNHYQPWRIILDHHLRIPLTARVVTDSHAARTIIITSPMAEEGKADRHRELEKRGVKVFPVPVNDHGFVMDELWRVLGGSLDDFHGITSILVEGGAKTWESFRQAGCVDEEVTLVDSPTLCCAIFMFPL